jgi:hypothetical protein
MKWWLEVTEWSDGTRNGIYLLDDSKSKMFAFRSAGQTKIKIFRNPIRIDTRGRKFNLNPTQYKVDVEPEIKTGRSWTVKGSRGDEYTINEHNGQWQCSCSGFKFRGQCKHIKTLRDTV